MEKNQTYGNPFYERSYQKKQQFNREQEQFDQFQATSLYCPKCKTAMPVNERLLLILPDGELYEYRCKRCGTSLGERKVSKQPEPLLVR
jgi:uncharacterized protein YbaR (Trm112 family)